METVLVVEIISLTRLPKFVNNVMIIVMDALASINVVMTVN